MKHWFERTLLCLTFYGTNMPYNKQILYALRTRTIAAILFLQLAVGFVVEQNAYKNGRSYGSVTLTTIRTNESTFLLHSIQSNQIYILIETFRSACINPCTELVKKMHSKSSILFCCPFFVCVGSTACITLVICNFTHNRYLSRFRLFWHKYVNNRVKSQRHLCFKNNRFQTPQLRKSIKLLFEVKLVVIQIKKRYLNKRFSRNVLTISAVMAEGQGVRINDASICRSNMYAVKCLTAIDDMRK